MLPWKEKYHRLFIILAAFFICNALMAEFIGVKIFSLEKLLGISSVNWTIFGQTDLGFNLTAGVILWPIVFVMTDLINEYYGRRGVRFLSFLAVGLILYAFVIVFIAIEMPPADFWPSSHLFLFEGQEKEAIASEVSNYDTAYRLVFGQGLWIIIGSLVAFLIGQMIDVAVFQQLKRVTGERKLWLRATGSTVVSQFIDSFVVLFIAFYIGSNWPLMQVLAIGLVNYCYKFIVAVVLTPLLYLAHYAIDSYLGEEVAAAVKEKAMLQG